MTSPFLKMPGNGLKTIHTGLQFFPYTLGLGSESKPAKSPKNWHMIAAF
jgi:hypothetical protein